MISKKAMRRKSSMKIKSQKTTRKKYKILITKAAKTLKQIRMK